MNDSEGKRLFSRSTTDIVVLMFATLICSALVIIIMGVIILRVVHPELDFSKAGDAVFNLLSTIIGALVGFVGGRLKGRAEANETH
jgi:hypothetical protein